MFGFCLLPPSVLAVLLWQNAVNVPYWDEWDDDIAGLFVKSAAGHLTFSDLWAQHNESRFVLPRLIFLALGSLTHWNLCYEMGCTFLLAGLAAGAVCWLGQKTFPHQPALRAAVFLIASLLIFSPAQYEAWLWGMELILYLPLVCLLGSLVLWQTTLRERTKILLCAGLAVVATYSFSNGLLVWIVLFPVLFLADGWTGLRQKSRAALGWMLAFFGNVALYFYGYQFPPSVGIWHQFWTSPASVGQYLCAFLGGPLVDHNAAHAAGMAAVIGGGLLLLFILAGGRALRGRQHSRQLAMAGPWLALGGYGLLSALLATAGRASLGADQALSSRYSIFGICLIVAVVHLLPLLVFHQRQIKPLKAFGTKGAAATLAVLGAMVIGLHALAFSSSVVNMSVFRLNLLHAKSCLKFIETLPPQPAVKSYLYHTPAKLKSMAEALERCDRLDYSLLQNPQLARFKLNPLPPGEVAGTIENTQISGATLFLSGWAFARSQPADCVLFTRESEGSEPVIFGLMDQRAVRPDLVQKNRNQSYLLAGWEKTIPLAELPKGPLIIKAWAYALHDDSLTPLASEAHLDNK